nr:Tn3 family transposase [Streptomyces broussonetiae]
MDLRAEAGRAHRPAALKDEVVRRWGVLDLLDVLTNADFDAGFTDEFASVAGYDRIDRAVLQRRLLLALFALGTNMGIRAIVATGEHGESEAALRHVRRHFITVDNLRAAVRKLVNATFAARDTAWWGQGTACVSDSKKFGSWKPRWGPGLGGPACSSRGRTASEDGWDQPPHARGAASRRTNVDRRADGCHGAASASTVRRRLHEFRAAGVLHFDVDVDLAVFDVPVRTMLWLTMGSMNSSPRAPRSPPVPRWRSQRGSPGPATCSRASRRRTRPRCGNS